MNSLVMSFVGAFAILSVAQAGVVPALPLLATVGSSYTAHSINHAVAAPVAVAAPLAAYSAHPVAYAAHPHAYSAHPLAYSAHPLAYSAHPLAYSAYPAHAAYVAGK